MVVLWILALFRLKNLISLSVTLN